MVSLNDPEFCIRVKDPPVNWVSTEQVMLTSSPHVTSLVGLREMLGVGRVTEKMSKRKFVQLMQIIQQINCTTEHISDLLNSSGATCDVKRQYRKYLWKYETVKCPLTIRARETSPAAF